MQVDVKKQCIDKQDITFDYLNKSNILQYAEQVRRFEAKIERYTRVLQATYAEMALEQQPSDIDEERQYRNTTIMLIDRNTHDIMCFCSYSCSHIRLNDGCLLPAIEIETFAMNKDYSGAMCVLDGEYKYSCSDYSIQFCINKFEEIKAKYIYASLVRVHSDTNKNVVAFYRRNNFKSFPCGWKFLRRTTDNPEYYFFRMLK